MYSGFWHLKIPKFSCKLNTGPTVSQTVALYRMRHRGGHKTFDKSPLNFAGEAAMETASYLYSFKIIIRIPTSLPTKLCNVYF